MSVKMSVSIQSSKKEGNRSRSWTPEEDQKLAQIIQLHGPTKWQSLAIKAGLNRCGKSCRLRWMNYLRPNIKRGNISEQEEDLILRLHKLLGNRWSLIAGRLPGRTDNEIKNYWNSHLSKKMKQIKERKTRSVVIKNHNHDYDHDHNNQDQDVLCSKKNEIINNNDHHENPNSLDLSLLGEDEPLNLEWMSHSLEVDENWFCFS